MDPETSTWTKSTECLPDRTNVKHNRTAARIDSTMAIASGAWQTPRHARAEAKFASRNKPVFVQPLKVEDREDVEEIEDDDDEVDLDADPNWPKVKQDLAQQCLWTRQSIELEYSLHFLAGHGENLEHSI